MPIRHVPPAAPALMASLRGLGYSLEAAIADLIDNSISAHSAQIDIQFDWNAGKPILALVDDGKGIDPDRMIEALRFGGSGPQEERTPSDLGRFGLGLKTASLSQCRRLTVVTKAAGGRGTLTWDVDHVVQVGGPWEIIEDEFTGPPHFIEALESKVSGTLVLWEKVDFGRAEDRPDLDQFLRDLERLEFHLGMVFWQYLSGGARKLSIRLNGRTVRGWDPFGSDLSATINFPEQRLKAPGGEVRIRGHVLPHRDRFERAADYERAGGPEGWTAQQGLYVYRANRLLIAGGWMGLGRGRAWIRDEPSRLARIRVEIGNTADCDWRIDVKKSTARSPDAIRSDLQRIAEDIRRRAREVFVHRGSYGARNPAASISKIWSTKAADAGARYRIRRDHQLIVMAQKRLGKDNDLLEALLDLIERTVSVERVWLDVTEKGAPETMQGDDPELLGQARKMVNLFLKAGLTREEAETTVLGMDPFDRILELKTHLSQRLPGDKK